MELSIKLQPARLLCKFLSYSMAKSTSHIQARARPLTRHVQTDVYNSYIVN